MDIFAHGLWAVGGSKVANRVALGKGKIRAASVGWTAFWGVFPDLFAFAPAWILLFWQYGLGGLSMLAPGVSADASAARQQAVELASMLYSASHSAVVFAVVFAVAALVLRRPVLAMLGWLLHILLDIPTHTAGFFATPALWPISDWKFLGGFSWGEGWFMAINYACLALLFAVLYRTKRS